jgi:hypothetical protein
MVVLTLKAKHDHLQNVASTHDHVKAISEFVWNALDADAKSTSVEFKRNALGGLESIIIRDNGTGISKERAEHEFESLASHGSEPTFGRPFSRARFMGRKARGDCASRWPDERTGIRSTMRTRRCSNLRSISMQIG